MARLLTSPVYLKIKAPNAPYSTKLLAEQVVDLAGLKAQLQKLHGVKHTDKYNVSRIISRLQLRCMSHEQAFKTMHFLQAEHCNYPEG
jgi:hypothetical protein